MKTRIEIVLAIVGLCWATQALAQSQLGENFTLLYSFTKIPGVNGTNQDGAYPTSGVVVDQEGNFYGLTAAGGAYGTGTLFKFLPDLGSVQALWDSQEATNGTGVYPKFGLIFDESDPSSNSFFGTDYGVAATSGSFFHITPPTYNEYFFDYDNAGVNPLGHLTIQDGLVYGITSVGGQSATGGALGQGAIYSYNIQTEKLTVLHVFQFNAWVDTNSSTAAFYHYDTADGAEPMDGVLISDGVIYGTTSSGGAETNGAIYSMKIDGSDFTLLHSFPALGDTNAVAEEGCAPSGGLTLSPDGQTLYGTTGWGGAYGHLGTVFKINKDGSGFTTLQSIAPPPSQYKFGTVISPLVCSPGGGVLYGVANPGTGLGGPEWGGWAFALSTNGSSYQVLHSFGTVPYRFTHLDGDSPFGLLLDNNVLYGVCAMGGTHRYGNIFSIGLGLIDSVLATNSGPDSVCHVGDPITVEVTAWNTSEGTFTDLGIDGEIGVNGSNSVSLPGVEAGPASVPELAALERTTFTFQFMATNFGTVTFSAAVAGTDPAGLYAASMVNTSAPVNIVPKGDLLIKAGYASNYVGAGIYQTESAPPQLVTNEVGTNVPASFDIQVINNENQPLDFTLSAIADGTGNNWITHYLLQGQDVTEDIQTNVDLPTLGPGESLTLVIDTSSTEVGTNEIYVALGFKDMPDVTLDMVEAVAIVTDLDLADLVFADPLWSQVGDLVTVVVTARNISDQTINDVEIAGQITVTETNLNSETGETNETETVFSLPGTDLGPTTAPQLAPMETANFTVQFLSTNFGAVTFSAAVDGAIPEGNVTTSRPGESSLVEIVPDGDLLIKASYESNYVGADVYQNEPAPPQIVTVEVQTNVTASFDIEVVNNEDEPMDFTLSATEAGTNWITHYQLQGQDILTNLALDLPTLEPGESLTLTIDTISDSEGSNDITLTLGFKQMPDATLDAVEAIAVASSQELVDSLSATPSMARRGDLITVVVTARNISDQTIYNVRIDDEISVNETNQITETSETNENESVSEPGINIGPVTVPELAPMETATFTVQFTATNFGTVIFIASVTGTKPDGDETASRPADSAPVDILPKGDLLIKASYESNYAGAGVYQTQPAPPQIVTVQTQTNEMAAFNIEIVNNEDEPMDFTLRAAEESTNWTTHYLLQGQDITEDLQTNMDLPTLAPGASLTLVIDTSSESEGSNVVTLALGFKDMPDVTLDTVEAIAEAMNQALVDSLSATPSMVHLGDLITVVVTARNISDQTINNVQIDDEITVTETNQNSGTETGWVTLLGMAAGPTTVPELGPLETASFTVQFTATNFGTVIFSAAVEGTDAEGDETTSRQGESAPVNILPRGDLLIKAGDESNYAGGGIYQTQPAPPQIVTNEVETNVMASFDIQIVNNENQPLDFTLSASEVAIGTNWTTHYLLQGQDVTENIQANMNLPPLAPGQSLTLVINTSSTGIGSNDTILTLGYKDMPGQTLDTVEAIAEATVTAPGSTLPEISFIFNRTSITFSWPLWATGFQLQYCSNLSAGNWGTVSVSPTTNGQTLSVTLPLTQTSGFFRLQRQ
jgi:uncharacterized repeat protein (TIGR03803 family)